MKAISVFSAAALTLLCMSGCTQNASSGAQSSAGEVAQGIQVKTAENFNQAYADCLKTYFTAIDEQDYHAYLEAVYQPYADAAGAYYTEKDSSLEAEFNRLCKRFDEDGYDGWRLTELELSYYSEAQADVDDFLNAYASAGIIDDAFIEACTADAEEMRNVKFTLYALYEGDTAPVAVVRDGEILMLKNAEGCFVFG